MTMNKETRRHAIYFFIFGWIATCFQIVMSVENTYHMWMYIGISTVGLFMLIFATTADATEERKGPRSISEATRSNFNDSESGLKISSFNEMADALIKARLSEEDVKKALGELDILHKQLDSLNVPMTTSDGVMLSAWGRVVELMKSVNRPSSAKQTEN